MASLTFHPPAVRSTSPDPDDSHSRSSSITSHAASTRYMLAGKHNNSSDPSAALEPPRPYGSDSPSRSLSPKVNAPLLTTGKGTSSSVNTHYLPSKLPFLVSRRIHGSPRGGGRDAFKANEARMPGEGDDDYDGVAVGGQRARKGRLRWNRFKWVLFVANLIFSIYSLAGLIACLLIHFNVWENADIIRVGNKPELIISTIAASIAVLTSLIGWSGILLNNRAFLAVYSFLLWICFAMLVTPGYITYKKRTFNLEGKINSQWSRDLGLDGRLRIQNQLHCCGYFNPFIEATITQTCYARSVLPGCKAPYIKFERVILERWYAVVFSIVPVQLAIMVSALLCSNHVTYRFGKGMMPKAYRLDMSAMATLMDNYATQLAQQYGDDVASSIMARSRSNLQLDTMPTVSYTGNSPGYSGSKYDKLGPN